jgi:hypothetical protein
MRKVLARIYLARFGLALACSAAAIGAIPAMQATSASHLATAASSAAVTSDCPTGVIGWDGCT